jgi:6-phosphogluconolactonase
MLVLIGTYTRNTDSEGIYGFDYDKETGGLTAVSDNAGIDNPSYITKHPLLDVVYVVNEIGDYCGDESGAVSAYSLDSGGKLSLINQQPSLGVDPCHLTINTTGTLLLVSNYSSGTLTSFPISKTGHLMDYVSHIQHNGNSVDPIRQKGPHVHSMNLGKHDKFVYVADLGLDQLIRYPVEESGSLVMGEKITSNLQPGAGPRHFCFDSRYEYCYVINEMDNTIVSWSVDTDGILSEIATFSTLPEGYDGVSYCGEIRLSPDGKYLYGSNRGHDSLVVFKVTGDGNLDSVQHIASGGKHPRHFSITPDGARLIVANRDSNNLVIFNRDTVTGRLSPTGETVSVPAPVCVTFCETSR